MLKRAYEDAMQKFRARLEHEAKITPPSAGTDTPWWVFVQQRYADPERQAAHNEAIRYASDHIHHTLRFVWITKADNIIYSENPDWRELYASLKRGER